MPYCFCDSARFTGGYLNYNTNNVIEISLKFEKITNESKFNTNLKRNANFLELSNKTLKDVFNNSNLVHDCVRDLLKNVFNTKSQADTNNTSCSNNETLSTPLTIKTADVIVHQHSTAIDDILIKNNNEYNADNIMGDLKVSERNSSKRSSMKSSKSMEVILPNSTSRTKIIAKSPDESKAKSVGNINDEKLSNGGEYENGESIELIFISDEFVSKVQNEQVIIVDEKDSKRRDSLINKKKIVIITDQYKEKVLRNNSIILTNEKKILKKDKKSKTYNTNSNSFLSYDEPDEKFDLKQFDKN
ncbi:hypothetical protein PVAND_006692 [Polypedilum vanderplanki]|uniref:Uncharacterized protein n=1 Tax=Polypedilum vanderplanki TaxID=319348 RepID=A0A9J6C4V9_POLVA|nr:hypothetical protein PVAND_006692 [Polypedilum vanderplanki]